MRGFLFIMALLAWPGAAWAARAIATSSVSFYVSPSGDDTRDCLDVALPCATIQRAYLRAKNDYDFAGHDCGIKLADGTYTAGLYATGQLVGTHLCAIAGNTANRDAVVVNPGPGCRAFDVQDGAIIAVSDLRIDGAGVIGVSGRQLVVVDIARVTFGAMPGGIAIAVVDQGGVNLLGDIRIDGDMVGFILANGAARVRFAGGTTVTFTRAVAIPYFQMSYERSLITYAPGVLYVNPGNLTGQQWLSYWDSTINRNGVAMPGTIAGATMFGGTVY